jgi:repressor LexA
MMRLGFGPVSSFGGLRHFKILGSLFLWTVAGIAHKVYTLSIMTTNHLSPKENKGLFFIRDMIRYRGRSPTLQSIADHLGFKSRRSSALLIEKLAAKGYIARTSAGNIRLLKEPTDPGHSERTIAIPLVGSAPCGIPMLAEENVEAMVNVSQRIARPGGSYFILRAIGTSMNKAGIDDGDLVIVRQQPVANDGDRIVAMIDDSATIKELRRQGDKIVLMPRSTDTHHQPIILERDFLIQGVVIEAIPYPKG